MMNLNCGYKILLLLLVSSNTLAELPQWYPAMTNEGADHMAQAYIFYRSQELAIESAIVQFPDLAEKLRATQASFEREFRPSIDLIDQILTARNRPWANGKAALEIRLQQQNERKSLSRPQAEFVIQEAERRPRGEGIPSPILETLLIYRPDFLRQPAEEFVREFKRTYSTGGSPKAKGLDVRIEHPISWRPVESLHPNVVIHISSENGRGSEALAITIKELDFDPETIVPPELIREIFSEEAQRSLLPNGAIFLGMKPIKLDGLEGVAVEFRVDEMRLDKIVSMHSIEFVVLYQNKLIMLTGAVSDIDAEDEILAARFRLFEPVFRLIANSFVLRNQWPTTSTD